MRHLIRLALTATLLIAAGGCASPEERGRAEAERDIKSGQLKLRTYGYPVAWYDESARLAKERLGVDYVVVGDCGVSETVMTRADAYNQRMGEEIDRRFGPGAIEAISKEAREKHLREHGTLGPRIW